MIRKQSEAFDSGYCSKCGVWRKSLHWDHIIPRWAGGLDEPSNIQKLCANCHEDKTNEERRSEAYRAFKSSQNLRAAHTRWSSTGQMKIWPRVEASDRMRIRNQDPEFRHRITRGMLESPRLQAYYARGRSNS